MIPVAVVTGPVGVGKSTVLQEADALLVEAGIKHATVELEDIARSWLGPAERGNAEIAYRNQASVWANYAAAGADRLLLGLLLEQRSELASVYEAIPAADITVVRLHAPLPLIEERLRKREITIPDAEVSAARWWSARLEGSSVADFDVDNSRRRPREVAADMLQRLGWLGR
jgi:chloramphenicol 3-O-phosphotransferase